MVEIVVEMMVETAMKQRLKLIFMLKTAIFEHKMV